MEEVAGVRVAMDVDSKPVVEYLVKWKVRPRPALRAQFAGLCCQRCAAVLLPASADRVVLAGTGCGRADLVCPVLKQQAELTLTLELAFLRILLVQKCTLSCSSSAVRYSVLTKSMVPGSRPATWPTTCCATLRSAGGSTAKRRAPLFCPACSGSSDPFTVVAALFPKEAPREVAGLFLEIMAARPCREMRRQCKSCWPAAGVCWRMWWTRTGAGEAEHICFPPCLCLYGAHSSRGTSTVCPAAARCTLWRRSATWRAPSC